MSNKHEPVSAAGSTPVPNKTIKSRALNIPVPAVLVGLGMLSSGAHAASYQDVYSTPVNTPLSGVNVFAADAANNPSNVTCTPAARGGAVNVTSVGGLFYTPPTTNVTSFIGVDTFSCSGTDNNGAITAAVQVYVGLPLPAANLPTVGPAALGGLAAVLAFFGLRRRRQNA